MRERITAEAQGLMEKAKSMQALQGSAQEHEEFRLRLEKETEVRLHELGVRQEIASSQAKVMASAMGNAKINLVGGDGQFLDQFFKTVSLGHSADGLVDQSDTAKTVFKDYLEGDASLREDLTQVLTGAGMNSESLKNLSIAHLLRKVSGNLDADKQAQLTKLIAFAEQNGMD